MVARRLGLILSLLILVSCGNKEKATEVKEDVNPAPEEVTLEDDPAEIEKEKALDLEYYNEYIFEKLDGATLIRDYGEDTGHTDMQFGPDGTFKGSYMGKKENDGFDAGLSDYAWTWYHGEEIHSSKFRGKFEIIEQINDYVYKMKLKDFKITSEYGQYDDIYFNVDFALGINPEVDYYLYIPGTPYDNAPGEDSRLDDYWNRDGGDGKSQGFTIWNKIDDELFVETY